jgi:hypothetical protein
MKRNLIECETAKYEEIEKEKIELEIDNVLVYPVDGVLIGGNKEEIRLLFFYIKPESYYEDENNTQCRCVAELRMSCSKFFDIANDINGRVKDIEMGEKEIEMFV